MVTKLTDFAFVQPITDTSAVPTIPASETALRGYLQGPPDELKTLHNNSVKVAVNGIIDIIPKICTNVAGTNTITANIDPAPAAYADLASNGTVIIMKVASANTGAVTLNLNSKGAVAVKKEVDQALAAGDLPAGAIVTLVHDGTNFQLIAVNRQTPAARVYHSASQAIPDGANTALQFNSERYDTDSIHDNVTNNARLTCRTAGAYSIFGNASFADNATGRRFLEIVLNGTTSIARVCVTAVNGAGTVVNVSTQYYLNAGDYVTLVATQNCGGDLGVDASGNFSPEFGMSKV